MKRICITWFCHKKMLAIEFCCHNHDDEVDKNNDDDNGDDGDDIFL